MRTAYTLIFMLTILMIHGQPVTPATELDYIIEEVVLPGGRLGNNVNCIVQGPYGFMWFGSHGGLHRYDGYEFTTYRNDDGDTIGETSRLSFPYVEHLFWDSEDKLWVATYGGGLYRFDPITEKFEHFDHVPDDPNTISGKFCTSVIEDTKGNIWVGTTQGLSKFDRQEKTFKRYIGDSKPGSLPWSDVRKLYVDKRGNLWVGLGIAYWGPLDGGLCKYDPQADAFINYQHDPEDSSSLWTNAVRGILEDSRGNFWVGTSKGLSIMDRQSGAFERMHYSETLPHAPGAGQRNSPAVYSILEDREGGIWVGTIMNSSYPTHLIRFDPKTKEKQVLPITSSVWDISESSDGTLWISGAGVSGKVLKIRQKYKPYQLSVGGGLYEFIAYAKERFPNSTFDYISSLNLAIDTTTNTAWVQCAAFFTHPDGSQEVLSYFLEDNLSSGSKTFHLIGKTRDLRDETNAGNLFGAVGLYLDNNGSLWGTFPHEKVGILKYNPTTGETVEYLHDPLDSNSISSNEIVTLLLDSKGEIWAATYSDGLNRLDPKTGNITRYHFDTQATPDAPIALMEGNDGKIWVGGQFMDESGPFLAIIDPLSNQITRKKIPMPGSFITVVSLSQAPNGSVALGISGVGVGLFFNEGTENFYLLSSSINFPISHPSAVVYDDDGILWVSNTDNNFARIEGGQWYLFEDYQVSNTTYRSGFKGDDGNIYFLNLPFRVVIEPESIIPESSNSEIELSLVDLYIMGEKQLPGTSSILARPIWLENSISFPASAQNFAFRFTDFDYQNPNIQFEYRLFPFESTWTRTVNTPIANYYRVPPGNYTFQIKTLKNAGFVDKNIFEFNVQKLPPWWATLWAYITYGIVFVGGVYGVHTFQKARVIRKERERIKDHELAQAKEIERAYSKLKETQSQLIHSEKMASLGELTAGIAHEIQNPLNFVNNFSDVNKELLEELKEAVAKGDQQEVNDIISDLLDNEEKVIFHGKRAEEIVKSMLQHSRGTEGKKEPTDINTLCDEYLRLAYHGLRAKDKSFNADFKTDLDPDLPKIEVVPQDIGRVLLNLINNAFQACTVSASTDRSVSTEIQGASADRSVNAAPSHVEPVKASDKEVKNPTVTVSTKKLNDKIEIRVIDNGPGVPDDIKDKIFQPFFSTKPTGQGTGLGLSMSYDIVTKGHGGSIEVSSKTEQGTTFTITLNI